MSERLEQILRVVCLVLAALLAVRVAFLLLHLNQLSGVRIPVQPHWAPGDDGAPTNQIAKSFPAIGTNRVGTNIAPPALANVPGTNVVSTNNIRTNPVSPPLVAPVLGSTNSTNTSFAATNSHGTNPPVPTLVGTNRTGTNRSVAGPAPGPGNLPPGMPPGGPGGMPAGSPIRPPRPLSPIVQARIDRITQSEMLAQIVHPPPMALLGIAGRDAFIRTPNGQTTMLRENGGSDGIKLLIIGTNRVLIEQGGEKKELTIFSGFGSQSLLPK